MSSFSSPPSLRDSVLAHVSRRPIPFDVLVDRLLSNAALHATETAVIQQLRQLEGENVITWWTAQRADGSRRSYVALQQSSQYSPKETPPQPSSQTWTGIPTMFTPVVRPVANDEWVDQAVKRGQKGAWLVGLGWSLPPIWIGAQSLRMGHIPVMVVSTVLLSAILAIILWSTGASQRRQIRQIRRGEVPIGPHTRERYEKRRKRLNALTLWTIAPAVVTLWVASMSLLFFRNAGEEAAISIMLILLGAGLALAIIPTMYRRVTKTIATQVPPY